MSISDILYTLLIGPLEVLFEIIYSLTYYILGNPGLSIIGLSLVMNLLLLPLYRQTDAIQEAAIETEKRMKPIVSHIKKTFHGNEQFMMLQTCYRQNHYKPTDALKGLSPLILEIPFFMAAYHFLANLELLQNTSFGPIADMGVPDGLLVIGGLSVNLLPILMTVINLASSLIYTKDAPLRTKIQLYGMAILFLVLLYSSPSGLVFYWTLNNLFSLVKNILMKTKHPARIVSVGSAVFGVFCAGWAVWKAGTLAGDQIAVVLVAAAALMLPLILHIFGKNHKKRKKAPVKIGKKDVASFLIANVILAVLVGLLIPSALIRNSPEEFIVIGSGVDPTGYVRYTALTAAGFFLIWLGVFYMIAPPAGKKSMETAVWILCAVSVTNYMWFGKDYGLLSSQLMYEETFTNSAGIILLNLLVIALVGGAVYLLRRWKPSLVQVIGLAAAIAMAGMGSANLIQSRKVIAGKVNQIQPPAEQVEPLFRLSKTGQNVVVLMMDRSAGALLPYLFHEKPVLQEQFAGFTYYPNTLSYGGHTNIALPSVFGGYEYRPREMNRRDQELLETKHNEALKVMPKLFQQAGFETTFCDPTYAGYDWIPDLSVFSDLPELSTHITMGRYNSGSDQTAADSTQVMEHKFLFYSIFKASPVLFHEYLYDDGSYRSLGTTDGGTEASTLKSYELDKAFRDSYNVLRCLPDLTEITEEQTNTLLLMCNDTTHSPQILQLPDYKPLAYVDNTDFDEKNPVRTDGEGHEIVMTRPTQVQHYHCNMAAMLELGKWLDYLREKDVFDNTRIIIVGDHAYALRMKEEMIFGDNWDEDIMFYNPLLMVKDFGSSDPFATDSRQMTNADVPSLAVQGLIDNPINPFTGNPLNMDAKESGTFYVSASHQFYTHENNGTTYLPDKWLQVHGDMMDISSWSYIPEDQIP